MEERQLSGDSVSSNDSAISSLNIGEQSVYARKKLDQLQERLENKTQVGITIIIMDSFIFIDVINIFRHCKLLKYHLNQNLRYWNYYLKKFLL